MDCSYADHFSTKKSFFSFIWVFIFICTEIDVSRKKNHSLWSISTDDRRDRGLMLSCSFSLTQESSASWLDSAIPHLSEIILLEDKPSIQMEVGVLVREFPDIRWVSLGTVCRDTLQPLIWSGSKPRELRSPDKMRLLPFIQFDSKNGACKSKQKLCGFLIFMRDCLVIPDSHGRCTTIQLQVLTKT